MGRPEVDRPSRGRLARVLTISYSVLLQAISWHYIVILWERILQMASFISSLAHNALVARVADYNPGKGLGDACGYY